MKFDIKNNQNPNAHRYSQEDLDIAYRFANLMQEELGSFIRVLALFGSGARNTDTPKSDIDVLIVVDDVNSVLTQELVEGYRIIMRNTIVKVSTKLHVISMRLTSFWEYMRNGDPIGINILRDGVPIIDYGFFAPMQAMLKRGRIRPTQESIWAYWVRAPNTLHNSKWHLMQATLDLYWAVIDAAHAALMKAGEIPPTPGHVADLLTEKLVKTKKLEKKYVSIMRNFYKLMKMITHREITQIKGSEFDHYVREAEEFVHRMKKIVESPKQH